MENARVSQNDCRPDGRTGRRLGGTRLGGCAQPEPSSLDVPAGFFKNCLPRTVTPSGVDGDAPIPDDYNYIKCGNNGEVKMQVRTYSRTDGSLQDNSLHFVMLDT
jgi:hypothetical protein